MFKKAIIGLMIAVLVLPCTMAVAQNYGQLMNAVEDLEQDLKAMVERETENRENQIEQLRVEIEQIRQMLSERKQVTTAAYEKKFDQLEKSMASLARKMNNLSENQVNLAETRTMSLKYHKLAALVEEQSARLAAMEARMASTSGRSEAVAGEEYVAEIEDLIDELRSTINENNYPVEDESNYASMIPEISGYVDATNTSDFNAHENETAVEQAEVDFMKSFGDELEVRADIEMLSNTPSDYQFNLEQAYFAYTIPGTEGIQFTFGKYNAPVGFDGVDAPDLYQYSTAYISQLSAPTNLVGMMLSAPLGEFGQISGLVANGWDVNTDNNSDKTFGAVLNFNLYEGATLNMSSLYGPEKDDNPGDKRMIFDMNMLIETVPQWTFGGGFNWGMEENSAISGSGDANWWGFLVMTRYDFTEKFGTTFRFDYFDDQDGSRTLSNQKLSSFTVCPGYEITTGLFTELEYRYTWSDEETFVTKDGDFKDNRSHLVWEFIFTF